MYQQLLGGVNQPTRGASPPGRCCRRASLVSAARPGLSRPGPGRNRRTHRRPQCSSRGSQCRSRHRGCTGCQKGRPHPAWAAESAAATAVSSLTLPLTARLGPPHATPQTPRAHTASTKRAAPVSMLIWAGAGAAAGGLSASAGAGAPSTSSGASTSSSTRVFINREGRRSRGVDVSTQSAAAEEATAAAGSSRQRGAACAHPPARDGCCQQ